VNAINFQIIFVSLFIVFNSRYFRIRTLPMCSCTDPSTRVLVSEMMLNYDPSSLPCKHLTRPWSLSAFPFMPPSRNARTGPTLEFGTGTRLAFADIHGAPGFRCLDVLSISLTTSSAPVVLEGGIIKARIINARHRGNRALLLWLCYSPLVRATSRQNLYIPQTCKRPRNSRSLRESSQCSLQYCTCEA
jgi:hypothetical protein